MRSRIDFIADRIERNLEESGVDANGEGVLELVWKEWPADAAIDAVTGSKSGVPTVRRAKVPAFLHFIPPTSVLRQFAEIQAGDCIVDCSSALDLRVSDTGRPREELRFIIDTVEWSSKPMSEHLAQCWDAMQAGQKLFQTVLLRKAT